MNLYLYVPLKGGTNAGEVYLKEVNWGCEVNSNYYRCYGRNTQGITVKKKVKEKSAVWDSPSSF